MDDLEDDDDLFEGIYVDGHWDWDDCADELVFISDISVAEDVFSAFTPVIIGAIAFRDDLDLLEQQRFRKRFQRKVEEDDIVTLQSHCWPRAFFHKERGKAILVVRWPSAGWQTSHTFDNYLEESQDVKDVVLFTAPPTILSSAIVKVLHLSITERFLRALILYCQYYVQTAEEMSKRSLELETKVRTPESEKTESKYRENLQDLRLLIAKEYCSMITGAGEISKFHHMGSSKKMRSLPKQEAFLFESVLRISIQIVWLALGRRSFNQIELEIHRLFKSQLYNIAEHKLKTKYETNMSPEERHVLLGDCVRHDKKLNTYSPLMNEVFCHRNVDYRIYGTGVIKYPRLNNRLRYMEHALIAPEELFECLGVTLGIIGLPRNRFDTMLREIKMPPSTSSTSSSSVRQSMARLASRTSRASRVSTTKSLANAIPQKLYKDIYIPERGKKKEHLPEHFESECLPRKKCNEGQRQKWLTRISRLTDKRLCSNRRKNRSKHAL